jgi:hypothetical protein
MGGCGLLKWMLKWLMKWKEQKSSGSVDQGP